MELRKYQEEAVDAVEKEWQQGRQHTLLVIPTGGGKTIIFSEIARRESVKGRVLILAHRDELIRQAADKLYRATGIFAEVEKGMEHAQGLCDVVVGSVQTLMRANRLEGFAEDYFDTVIVDEAHHCLADSYRKILEHFKKAKLLGVTATPDRGDKKTLAEVFDSIAYEYSLTQAIQDGYLVPPKAVMIPLKIDLSKVKTSMGDYTDGSLGEALEPYLEQIADEMTKYAKGRKTVVFLPLIATSQAFCEMLKQRGFRAAEVNGQSRDRKEILKGFEDGTYDILCNSMLLTEGWDCPAADCIVVLRPTRVRSLYQQMVGRGMRLSPETGKDHLLLLDFLWMTERHDLCRPSALVSKDASIAEKLDEQLAKDDEPHDLIEAEEDAERDVLAEREAALARELAEMRRRKRKLRYQ